jgi:hypothetical protein
MKRASVAISLLKPSKERILTFPKLFKADTLARAVTLSSAAAVALKYAYHAVYHQPIKLLVVAEALQKSLITC